jgi:intraflagellar transport protein 140
MSLYFFSKLQQEGRPLPELTACHPVHPFAAVAWNQNVVTVSNADGEIVGNVSRNVAVTAMAWHPEIATVAIGWKDGAVSVWQDGAGDFVDSASAHQGSPVMALAWNSKGILGATTKGCVVSVWQLDDRKLALLWSSKSEIVLTSLVDLSSTNGDSDVAFMGSGTFNTLYLIDDTQNVASLIVLDRDAFAVSTVWDEKQRRVVVLASTQQLSVFSLDDRMTSTLLSKRKISTGPSADVSVSQITWASQGLLATTSGEGVIRFFNLEQDAMYTVIFPDNDVTSGTMQKISGITTLPSKNLLAVSTKSGRIAVWSFNGTRDSEDEQDWQLQTDLEAEDASGIDSVRFTAAGTIIAAQSDSASVMQETPRVRSWCGTASVVQVAPDTVVIETVTGSHFVVKNNTHVKAVSIVMPQVAIFNGKQLEIYALSESSGSVTRIHTIDQANDVIALHADGILVNRGDKLVMLNFQLHQVQQLAFSEAEGMPSTIDVLGDFVVIVTNKNIMKVCRISARDLKAVGPTRNLLPADSKQTVSCARVNAKGKKVAFLSRSGNKADNSIYVYDLDTDLTSSYDFGESNRTPTSVTWNRAATVSSTSGTSETENLLLAVETHPLRQVQQPAEEENVLDGDEGADASRQVTTLFASLQGGVMVHHTRNLKREHVCVVGCTVPHLALCKASGTLPSDYRLDMLRLRDFEGMSADNDPKVRDALIQFSYCTTMGNMDEAYKAVKTVKDPSVWINLAKMCVTTKRLDVAEVCLANMNDAVAARALRESRGDVLDARLAVLATSLGMLDDAEKLLRRSKRYDLLTELYAACGKWETATKHAELNDRIRIYPLLYRHAHHMEQLGNVDQALQLYEQAKCFGTEGPRLLFAFNRVDELRARVASGEDKELSVWWAQFLESTGDSEGALKCYTDAKDGFNMVRILTCQKQPDLEKAMELVADTNYPTARGAAYFIARHFEEQRNVQQAMHFYDVAGAVKNAIRLAKESDLFGDIVSLSLKCGDKHVALESAAFFEERTMYDKAAQLFQKGGDSQRAIDVCIKGGLYDELHRISESLDAAADPETFIAMAEHFINSGHFDKAVAMLVFGKAFNEALQLCVDKGVPLTDEMADAMTLPKTDSQEDEEYRVSLLKKIAKVAKAQESWHLACKKYTQAGERSKAMKMLLRSGDTEKIIFFANHSRNAEIFVLAANFLQSQDWKSNAALYKSIVTFYTKAKAFESLALFYDSCAQLQVDEYRDYDKALVTLRESQKALDKGDVPQDKKDLLRRRVDLVEMFVNARQMIKPGEACPEMVEVCTDLLNRHHRDHPEHEVLETAVRVGDIYALLVEYYDKLGQSDSAFSLIEKMQEAGIELTYFLEATLVEKICTAVGRDIASLEPPKPAETRRDVDDDMGFQVDEDVE